jgi:hypothetical protein
MFKPLPPAVEHMGFWPASCFPATLPDVALLARVALLCTHAFSW